MRPPPIASAWALGMLRRKKCSPGSSSIVDPNPPKIVPPAGLNSTGRRTALANWIASPENPLTARVMVNRIWNYHFGQGIAPAPSDFGLMGGRPSHPELLDWLASEFVQQRLGHQADAQADGHVEHLPAILGVQRSEPRRRTRAISCCGVSRASAWKAK